MKAPKQKLDPIKIKVERRVQVTLKKKLNSASHCGLAEVRKLANKPKLEKMEHFNKIRVENKKMVGGITKGKIDGKMDDDENMEAAS